MSITQIRSNEITPEQLNALYQAEDALSIVHPYYEEYRNAVSRDTEIEFQLSSISHNKISQIIEAFLAVIISIPCLICFLSAEATLFKIISGSFFVGCLIVGIPNIINIIKRNSNAKKLKDAAQKNIVLKDQAKAKYDELCNTYATQLSYIDTLATEQCNDPYYLRL